MNKKLINEFKDSIAKSATEFTNSYVNNEEYILKKLETFDGIKSELYVKDINSVLDISKYLSLYSDFTSVFMLPDGVKDHLIIYYPPDDPHFIKRNITFPIEELNGVIPESHELLPAYTTQTDVDMQNAYRRLTPFIDQGKFMMRPVRTIMLHKPSESPRGKVDGQMFYANSDTPNDEWHVKRLNEKNSYTINNGLNINQAKSLYEITLPYINNLSIATTSKIIEEESDLLGAFRVTLKQLMEKSIVLDKTSIDEFRNDMVRPQIENINRKFNTVTNNHRLAVGTSVLGITLTLVGLVAGHGTDFQSIFNPYVAGGGGVGMIATEIYFQSETDKLKDNPYFLLWKLNKAKASRILGQFNGS